MGLYQLTELLEQDKPILFDGAMGTELKRRFNNAEHPLYTAIANLEAPELVKDIHKEYIAAGARIIRVNSFMTAEVVLRSGGLGGYRDELPELAADIAQQAVDESGEENVIVAATLAPLGAYFKSGTPSVEELQLAQEKHAARLSLSGVEVAFCETMTSVNEAIASIRAAQSSGLEAIVSFVPSDARHILSGETLDTAIRSVIPLNPLAISLNCADATVLNTALATLMSITALPTGAYASVEQPRHNVPFQEHQKVSVIRYVRHAREWNRMGIKLIGGCCGTTPAHIQLIREKLQQDTEQDS